MQQLLVLSNCAHLTKAGCKKEAILHILKLLYFSYTVTAIAQTEKTNILPIEQPLVEPCVQILTGRSEGVNVEGIGGLYDRVVRCEVDHIDDLTNIPVHYPQHISDLMQSLSHSGLFTHTQTHTRLYIYIYIYI